MGAGKIMQAKHFGRGVVQSCRILILLFGMLGSIGVRADRLDIHVSPAGVDTASGTSAKSPVATLSRVQEIVVAQSSGHDEVRVLFAPGVYSGQGVEWRTFPGMWIRFQPAKQGESVIFDGNLGKQSIFFEGLPPTPEPGKPPISMKLAFTGLIIRNYCEGISFRSWTDKVRRPGGRDVIVKKSVFENIGSKYDPVMQKKRPRGNCTAALRLQGVGHGRIEDNVFTNIINLPRNETGSRKYGSGLLHAIYIANMSQDNSIVRNRFDNFSGDAIRIRDASDRNYVTGNVFGAAASNGGETVHAISQWYCNPKVPACIQRAVRRTECESSDLQLSDNRIEGKNVADYSNRAEGKATCVR